MSKCSEQQPLIPDILTSENLSAPQNFLRAARSLSLKLTFRRPRNPGESPGGKKKKFVLILKDTQNNPDNSGSELLSSPDIVWILLAVGLMEVHSLKFVLPKMTVLINTKIKESMLFILSDMDLQKADFAEIIWYLSQKSKMFSYKVAMRLQFCAAL